MRELPSAHPAARTRDERFRPAGGAQRFLSALSGISPHFLSHRYRLGEVVSTAVLGSEMAERYNLSHLGRDLAQDPAKVSAS